MLPNGVKDFLPVKAAKIEYLKQTLHGIFSRMGIPPRHPPDSRIPACPGKRDGRRAAGEDLPLRRPPERQAGRLLPRHHPPGGPNRGDPDAGDPPSLPPELLRAGAAPCGAPGRKGPGNLPVRGRADRPRKPRGGRGDDRHGGRMLQGPGRPGVHHRHRPGGILPRGHGRPAPVRGTRPASPAGHRPQGQLRS